IEDFHADTPTNQLKATFEQAIFYGAREENPFLFTVSPSVEGSFDQAACAVSNEIVNSSSVLLPAILDQRLQLSKRMELLRALILFINENGVGGHLSTSGKKLLSDGAEKIFMALTIWQHVNNNPESRTVLEQAVFNFMQRSGKTFGDDPVRMFFRTKVDEFQVLFRELYEIVQPQSSASRRQQRSYLQDVNRIIIIAFDSMLKHREETHALYGIPSDDRRASQWTNGHTIVDIVSNLFDATSSFLMEQTKDGHAPGQKSDRAVLVLELQDQLKHLAEMTFWVFSERIAHLQRLLAHLCNEPQALQALDGSATADEICEAYITQYQDKFAFELYLWYTDNGARVRYQTPTTPSTNTSLRAIAKASGSRPGAPRIVTPLFGTSPQSSSFMAPLSFCKGPSRRGERTGRDCSGGSSGCLKKGMSSHETVSPASNMSLQVEFALAKLCNLAQATVTDERTSPAFEAAANVCTKELETISTYEELRREFLYIVEHYSGAEANRVDQPEVIASANLSLREGTAIRSHFKNLTRQILQGKTLDFEDLIDILTLKPQNEQLINGFWDAIAALNKSKGMYDSDVSAALRGTIVFRLMQQMSGLQDCDNAWLRPQDALLIPTIQEISARFPQFSDAQAQALSQDYLEEQENLQDAIDSLGLEELYDATYREVGLASEGR
ncbi:hypothetical protein FRC00_002786, partial [Tulasnella sp. 408]